MNVLIIPAFFRTKDRPTLGSFFWDQARALKRAGHQVTILYCDTYSVKCVREYVSYAEEPSKECEGIQIHRMKVFCPLKHGIEGHREAFTRGIQHLYESYNQENGRPDVLHAHCCVWAGYAAMRLSEKTGIPYIITEHATLFELHKDKISKFNQTYIRQAFGNAARVICVSTAFAKLISDYRTSGDIQVIGNVVDFDQFKPCKSEPHSEMRFLTICYMNTKDQLLKKGMDILLEAWREFSRKYDTVKLIIGGGGHAGQKAVEWCREYGVEQSVEFAGSLSREQVAEQMQACDVFVLPSRYETFGVVYIEAMACGKPVIAAANGGPDDFVTNENGILIPPDDAERLVWAMEQVMQNQNRYDMESIRGSVKNKFSSQAIAGQLECIYEDVKAGAQARLS
ncbi:MAG: glycosyltransferase [Lachnospiraceae bacterium]|nr:glycosyltransferase [Lachnospiraceae bacterium]